MKSAVDLLVLADFSGLRESVRFREDFDKAGPSDDALPPLLIGQCDKDRLRGRCPARDVLGPFENESSFTTIGTLLARLLVLIMGGSLSLSSSRPDLYAGEEALSPSI